MKRGMGRRKRDIPAGKKSQAHTHTHTHTNQHSHAARTKREKEEGIKTVVAGIKV